MAGSVSTLVLSMALAAPPADAPANVDATPEQDPICDVAPTLDDAYLMAGRDMYGRGNERFEARDYLGAIELWEQVLVLMPSKRASLRVNLAHAHHYAYALDADETHLSTAHTLFTEKLTELDAGDAGRGALEAELTKIEAQLAALAAERARARAEREDAVRQEQIRLNAQALAKADAAHHRKLQRVYYGIGGALAGLGVGTLAGMTALLALGEGVDRQGVTLASNVGHEPSDYVDLLIQGQRYNDAAVATGVVGGVLVLSGSSLLLVAAIRHRRGPQPTRERAVVFEPTLGGTRLRF